MNGMAEWSKTTLADRIILILALILVGWLYWQPDSPAASFAVIFSPSQPPQLVELSHPQQLHIQGRLGISVIEVAPWKIRFLSSPCSGKQCIHAGWLKSRGDLVACLPNQIKLELPNSEPFDAIAY